MCYIMETHCDYLETVKDLSLVPTCRYKHNVEYLPDTCYSRKKMQYCE